MEKEMLMNAMADIDFLLMITGFSLFLAVASLVIMVGVWEAHKDLKKYTTDLAKKHNLLLDKVNDDMIPAINKNSDSLRTVGDVAEKSLGKNSQALCYIKEAAEMSNDAFNDIRLRLEALEKYNQGFETEAGLTAGAVS